MSETANIVMDETYHYPPEVLNLLVDTIPLLCRSKKDVIVFFRGAGVSEGNLDDLRKRVDGDPKTINKYEIARTVLQRINEQGDRGLRTRREVIKRIVEFEDFSTCWPQDELKAKGLVAELRRTVNVKDSFTRLYQERERERQERAKEQREKAIKEQQKKQDIAKIRDDLYGLFASNDRPQERGKLLESVINRLFSAYGILVKEDFRRRSPDGPEVTEQIDGVISFDGNIYLVEMKWMVEPIGVPHIAQHLVRLFGRADGRGLYISFSSYTAPAISQCREVLAQKCISLCTVQEIVHLLEREGDLTSFLRSKVQAAIIDKQPFVEMLE